MRTNDTASTPTVEAMGMTDEEAIAVELQARIEAYGGINAYCRDFDLDKRNVARFIKEGAPKLKPLMAHIRNLGVDPTEFFASADDRARRG
jgi:hypothetical protein